MVGSQGLEVGGGAEEVVFVARDGEEVVCWGGAPVGLSRGISWTMDRSCGMGAYWFGGLHVADEEALDLVWEVAFEARVD